MSLTVLVVLLFSILLAVYYKHQKLPKPSVPNTPPSSPSISLPHTDQSSITTLDDYISDPQLMNCLGPRPFIDTPPPSPASFSAQVLVLYSLSTPEHQIITINNSLVGGLKERYGITAESPGTTRPRLISRDWLEQSIRQAKAVLLVCNEQFYAEWTGRDTHKDYKLRIGWEVKLLKDGMKDADLAKFAYIYFEETDFSTLYPQLSHYIKTRFSLTGNLDTILSSIAKFVEDSPEFELC